MVSPYSLAVHGGVQEQVMGLARSLRKKGVEVQVLGPCDGIPPEPWVIPLGNSIPFSQNGSLAPLAPDPSAQLRTIGVLKNTKFDLIHLHEPLVPGPTLTSLLYKPSPIIGTFHVSGKVGAYKWGRPLTKMLASRVDLKVAVSPEAAGMVTHYLGGELETLFNGIDVEKYSREYSKKDGLCVLFLGRHEQRKGLAVLLASLDFLPPDMKLWIAGEGPETDILKNVYSDDQRISWLGKLSDEEKINRLNSANVLCVPSLGGESFGIVLLEAMAARLPVVASDLPAYSAVARGGKDAMLFSTGSSKDLAKSIIEVVNDSSRTNARVESGFERACEFSIDKLADAYLARYQRVMQSKVSN